LPYGQNLNTCISKFVLSLHSTAATFSHFACSWDHTIHHVWSVTHLSHQVPEGQFTCQNYWNKHFRLYPTNSAQTHQKFNCMHLLCHSLHHAF
jgi:hypothetical protein